MKKFLIKITIFNLFIILGFILGLTLPTTPRASKSGYFSSIQKDSLLANVDSPRMIFIGGSNISFGLNSQMIRDSLNINPINTGISAGIGLKYMLDNTVQYIKKGDIIVAPLEYIHYTNDYNHCTEPLLRIIMDVNKKKLRLLSFRQACNLLAYFPKYLISKLKPNAYFDIYFPYNNARSFNEYGDECAHWNMENRSFSPYSRLDDFNRQIIDKLKDFEKIANREGARFYITYPSYMDESFYKSEDIIELIRNELEKNFNNKILGYPTRYMMPDSLMFDTSYHLNKTGADIRTARLIEDIKNVDIFSLNEN
jgi:ribosomal protein S17E